MRQDIYERKRKTKKMPIISQGLQQNVYVIQCVSKRSNSQTLRAAILVHYSLAAAGIDVSLVVSFLSDSDSRF